MTYKSDDTLRRIANQENVFVGEHAFDLKLKSDQLTTELFYKDTHVSISHVVAGYNHAAVLRVDGRVIAWGGNDELQSTVPVGFTNIQQIAAGYAHTVVLYKDGSVASWGRDIGAPAFSVNQITQVTAGCWHTVALKKDGTVLAWGVNDEGQCDVPPFTEKPVHIAAGYFHTVMCHADGHVTAWGRNNDGQTNVPAHLNDVISVAASINHTVALRKDGTVIAWGANQFGQCDIPTHLTAVIQIAAGDGFTLALLSDGSMLSWGNLYIPLGIGVITQITAGHTYVLAVTQDNQVIAWSQHVYIECPGEMEWISHIAHVVAGLFHTVAIRENGTVIAWGKNTYGQCDVPAHIKNVKQVALGLDHTVVLMSDGTVDAWGRNSEAQSTVPTPLANVIQIAAGHLHSVALCADGTVVAWGDNTSGQCDIPTGLANVQHIIAGVYNTIAHLHDGTICIWGNNDDDQCAPPKEMGSISHVMLNNGMNTTYCMALTDTHQLVMWGNNDYSQCDIPSDLTNVHQISGGEHYVAVICDDATLVVWGASAIADVVPTVSAQKVVASTDHMLVLTNQHRVIASGFNINGLTNVPVWLRNVRHIDAGVDYSIVLTTMNNTTQLVTWRSNRIVDVDRLVQVGDKAALAYFHPFVYKSGGEARLYSVDGKIFKKYKQGEFVSRGEKIQYLLQHRVVYTDRDRPLIIWPEALAYHPFHGNLVGYVMPFVDAVPLLDAYTHEDRIKHWSRLSDNDENEHIFIYTVARWCANVLARIHEEDYIVGDLNPRNILVYDDGVVAFIDCDSFQVGDGSEFGCRVGWDDYLAPEILQHKMLTSNENIPFTKHSDAFALAVVIFRLLSDNWHPYQGITLPSYKLNPAKHDHVKKQYPHLQPIPDAVEPTRYCQRRRTWPYDPNQQVCVPPRTMQAYYPQLPAAVRELFGRAFTGAPAQRPTPAEWVQVLDAWLREVE